MDAVPLTRNQKLLLPYFFDQTLWLLFKGGIYFLGNPTDINDSSIRHVRAIQLRLLGTVSSTHSLSVLLSAVETSRTTKQPSASLVTVVRDYSQSCSVYTSHGYYLRAVFISLRASNCAATIQRNTVYRAAICPRILWDLGIWTSPSRGSSPVLRQLLHASSRGGQDWHALQTHPDFTCQGHGSQTWY